MAAWGLRREAVLDPNGWFFMLWSPHYAKGRSFRPSSGDFLKVWDKKDDVFSGDILEVLDFSYSSPADVEAKIGKFRDFDLQYVWSRFGDVPHGRCVAVRTALQEADYEPCPIEGMESWIKLS